MGYIHSLLDRSTSLLPPIRPRLKSRFEGSQDLRKSEVINKDTSSGATRASRPVYKQNNNNVKDDPQQEIINTIKQPLTPDNTTTQNTSYHQERTEIESHHFSQKIIHTLKEKEIMPETKISEESKSKQKSEQPSLQTTKIELHENFGLLNQPNYNIPPPRSTNHIHNAQTENTSKVDSGQPSIYVSIGRVEVKAIRTTPKKTFKKSIQKPPRLSLQDYIEKRK